MAVEMKLFAFSRQSVSQPPPDSGWTYLGIEAAGSGTEFEEEFTFWTLFVVGVKVESWARGTFPMRYQIPMLFSSLRDTRGAFSQEKMERVLQSHM